MFLQGFHVEFRPPTYLTPLGVDPFGTSLTVASPFIFAAFWAKWDKPRLATAWVSIGLILLHGLSYYNNGSRQWNAQRFSLDFWPVLILLVARGIQRANNRVWKMAIIYAILLNGLVFSIFR